MQSLRFDGENDEEFRRRAERTAGVAKVLIHAALANQSIRRLIADPAMSWTADKERRSPTVRVEFEEAIAIGGIGECLEATKHKHWGDFLGIAPLMADEPVDPRYILYVYRANSRYNRRYEQRRRMKELLGREFRPLVESAKYHTKGIFLDALTGSQVRVVRTLLGIEPDDFWRAAQGKIFLSLPSRDAQL